MGKASQLPFLAKSLRQEIDLSESDSTIIKSHPLLAPSLHPCKIAKASAIATPLAFIRYLRMFENMRVEEVDYLIVLFLLYNLFIDKVLFSKKGDDPSTPS